MANQVVELLFGVQGGTSLNGHSGAKIKEDILGIVQNLKDTKFTQVEFSARVSKDSLTRLRQDVESVLKDIKVDVVFEGKAPRSLDVKSGRSGNNNNGGSGSKTKEASEVAKLIKAYKEYFSWKLKAAQAPAGGEEQAVYFDAAAKSLQEARQMLRSYKLEGDDLIAFHEKLNELYDVYNTKGAAFNGKLLDEFDTAEHKEHIREVIELYKHAHRLSLEALKTTKGYEKQAEIEFAAVEALTRAENAQKKYNLVGQAGVEIAALLAKQKIELTEATKRLAGAERDATNAAQIKDDANRIKQLDKLVDAYMRVGTAQQAKTNAHSNSEYDSAQKREIAEYSKALSMQNALKLSASEMLALNARLKKEAIDLSGAFDLYVASLDETVAAEARKNEVARKQEQQNKKSIATIRNILKQLQVFEERSNHPLVKASIPPEDLTKFQAQVDKIRTELAKLGITSSEVDISLDKIDDHEQLRAYLHQLLSLNSGLSTAAREVNGLATANVKLETSYHKLANRAYDYMTRIQSSLSHEPAMMVEMQNLVDKLRRGQFDSVAHGVQEFQKLQFRIKQAGLEAETLGEQVRRVFKEKFGFGVMATAAMYARSAISDVARTVVDLDTKLTELKIVSGETGSAMVKYMDDAAAAAKRVASSITDIIDATTVYRRLGFEMSKSLDFAELTTMYSKVGAVDMSQAEENITAIIKAYNLEDINDLRYALDQMVATGNNLPISASGLGQALNNAASSLVSAGNNFQESLALLTASNTITQDPDKASTALRTISARLRQSTAELEDLGEELDETYNTVSAYQAKFKSLTGVDILEEDQETYKSTYQILKELSEVWETLSEMDKQAVTYMASGIRQGNVFSSIMTEFGDAEKTLKVTAEAAGSMQTAYENYIDSIQGRLNTLTASSQELFNNLLDSDLIKGGVTTVTALVEALNSLIETIGLLPTVGAGVGIAKLISSVGGAKMIALINAPTYVPVVTRNELAA